MGIFACAKGSRNAASTPVIEKGKGPSSFSATQPFSERTPSGTRSSSHTMESSSLARTTEKSGPSSAHGGSGESASKRHTASRSERRRNFNRWDNPQGGYYRNCKLKIVDCRLETRCGTWVIFQSAIYNLKSAIIPCSRPSARSDISFHQKPTPSFHPDRYLPRYIRLALSSSQVSSSALKRRDMAG